MPRLKPTPKEINLHMSQLSDTVPFLQHVTAGLDEEALKWSPTHKDWSVVEILAHVRACADVWTYSICVMLVEIQPFLPLIDERRWAKTLGYPTLRFEVAFSTFSVQREELLRTLRELNPEQWKRTCQIEGRNHSVFSQVRRMALHEVEHMQQFQDVDDKLKTKDQL